MALLNDRVQDEGLSVLTSEGNRLDICSAQPATYADAIGGLSLGNKLSPSIGAPQDRIPNGRKVTVAAISNGNVTANGTASHWAIVDTVNSRLLAANTLQAPQVVTLGNTFTLNAFDIGIPDPAA